VFAVNQTLFQAASRVADQRRFAGLRRKSPARAIKERVLYVNLPQIETVNPSLTALFPAKSATFRYPQYGSRSTNRF
jgi:hypothetical protein